jgi:hypothetical protein
LVLALTAAGVNTRIAGQSQARGVVAYPEGYREWAHVKSALVTSRHPDFKDVGGFRHIYANRPALVGYRAGKFPDGAIIVVDWLEGRDESGAFTEGERRRVDVMMKDRSRFAATGGWGFERFDGDSSTARSVSSPADQCFTCHSNRTDHDSVFSASRK